MRTMRRFSLGMGVGLLALLAVCVGGAWAAEAVIGFTGPLSGPAAQYGRDCLAGVELAVKDINRTGGIKIGDMQEQLIPALSAM